MLVSEGGDSNMNSAAPSDPTSPSEPSSELSQTGRTCSNNRPYPLMKVRRWLPLGLLAAAIIALWAYIPPVYKLVSGPVTVTRYDRRFGATQAVVGPGLKGWISTAKISKHALHAIIAEEDGRFYEHHGLDLDQMRKSYVVNLRRGRYARGASTISQQVVKMAFLTREKTLSRKVREAIGTILMELLLTKDQILEWYINMAEFGDGVYGIEEGCWHYFRTKPEQLTVSQAVHLALVLPSPNGWSRGLRRKVLTPFGQRRFLAILSTMRNMGFITKTQWTAAVTTGDFGRPLVGYTTLVEERELKGDSDVGKPTDTAQEMTQDDADAESPDSDEAIDAGPPEPQL